MTALTKSRLTELLERVEAASGADRELDALIACHFVFKSLRPATAADVILNYVPRPGDIKTDMGFLMADPYTASLDAALALVDRVLPGWCKSAVDLRPEPCEGYVWERGHVGNIQGKAPTPALAVLAAMLRALGDGHASCPS
jgi:hypothetical protein